MKIGLQAVADDGALVLMRGDRPLAASDERELSYGSRTSALLRVGGIVRGAFDGEHERFVLPAGVAGDIELEVERRSLPTSGLPPGDGPKWRLLLKRAVQAPPDVLRVARRGLRRSCRTLPRPQDPLPMVGHSHLDVAWLWTYEEAVRKAIRTFATAVRQLESDPAFIFTQTTPQLYRDVAEREPELFARMQGFAREGRLDTSGAALWVECDCNLPSGESLLRQLVYGIAYVEEVFGATPSVAWLPDTFGFANTLPMLLRHAGVGAFGTTKLSWNDTTRWELPQFVWEAPDGSSVVAAHVYSIEGGVDPIRVGRARERGDLLLVGRGDGGGGVADDTLAAAPSAGTFTTLGAWFAGLAERRATLPVVRDELYLENHRGTLTTHRDVKARNAALERALGETELLLSWAVALRASPFFVREARASLAHAWRLLLRAQFHDVLPGSAIAEAYVQALEDLEEAAAIAARLASAIRGVLPSSPVRTAARFVEPREERRGLRFENGRLSALVRRDGSLSELRIAGGRNVLRRGNVLQAYVDRPKQWDAWNVDASYRRRPARTRRTGFTCDGDGAVATYAIGKSSAALRVALAEGAGHLRVELAVDWREPQRLLRLEHDLAFAATRARYGSPYGVVERAARPRSAAERAKFEAPGQRFARVEDARGGLAVLSRDTYGWSTFGDRRTHVGNSLLRAPLWPDPAADRGEHEFAFGLVPFEALGMGELETAYARYALGDDATAPIFQSDHPAVVVVATKPAEDGDGLIVRARECDGVSRDVALRSAVRVAGAACVDARERDLPGEVQLAGESLVAHFEPHALRSFRVRLP